MARAAHPQKADRGTPPSLDRTDEGLARELAALIALDPRLAAVRTVAGAVHRRTRPAGFEGLARIICGQQVSVASADAIWGRLAASSDGMRSPDAFLALGETGARAAGLSRNKYVSIHQLAESMQAGALDLHAIAALPAQQAIDMLTRQRGVGPWTAEIYLMFCAGHPDIFPAGDLALRRAVGQAFAIEPHPQAPVLQAMALRWAPHRSVAALLFWRFYAATRHRDAIPI